MGIANFKFFRVFYKQLFLFDENLDVKQNDIYSPECFGRHSDVFIDSRYTGVSNSYFY